MAPNKKSKTTGDALIFPTITMPNSSIWSTLEQAGFAGGGLLGPGITDVGFTLVNNVDLLKIKDQNKWNNPGVLTDFQKFFVKSNITQVKGCELPSDYQYFGTSAPASYEQYFSELIKTNPFFVSALRKTPTGYELNFTTPLLGEKDDWTFLIVHNLDPMYIRFNVKFNNDFTIGAIDAFKKLGNKVTDGYAPTTVTPPPGVSAREYSILGAIFCACYYSEVVHATLHVYHYVMTAAMEDSCREGGSSDMNDWVDQYDDTVWLKYQEVKLVLFNDGGALCGNTKGGTFVAKSDDVIPIATRLFNFWSGLTEGTDFVNRFILAGVGGDFIPGLLTQYQAEAADINGFALDLAAAFQTLDKSKPFNKTTNNLKLFLENVNNSANPAMASSFTFQGEPDSIRRWTTLMSATGILHAGTFSFSRLFVTQPIIALSRPNVAKFSSIDTQSIALVIGTVIGIKDGRHVYTDKSTKGFNIFSQPNKLVKKVLQSFNDRASFRRTAYFQQISARPDFKGLGWLWTDYCEDQVDNKQVTIATYV